MNNNLQATFGNIDIYLFDQLLKGRYNDCKKVIDVGCGGGRNIVYFLQNGYEVYGVDRDATAVEEVRALSLRLASVNPTANFKVANVEDIPFADESFDLAICSAVLHFANNEAHFNKMLHSIWRILKPGGFLFARLASNIGIENLVQPLGNGRYLLPDGSERFLVNEQELLNYTHQLNGILSDPIKTTNVSNIRCMTTWGLIK